jgi:protease I
LFAKKKQEVKNLEGGEQKMGVLSEKKVLMVIAPRNFRDEEFFKPRVALQSEGAGVIVASKTTEEVTGMLGGKTKPDVNLSEVKVQDYDGIVFVGGTGSSVYFNDQQALNLAKEAVGQNKVVGAICIAPSILANAGVLQNRKVTSFSSEKNNLEAKGAKFVNQPVVVDGKIVTATGPQAAEAFGQKLVEVLGQK